MKKVTIVDKGEYKFEIVQDDGETLESLAINLAEAYSNKNLFENQGHAFMQQAQFERQKANDRTFLLFKLDEYKRDKKNWGPDHKISRMEPMETYDPEMLEEERQLFLKRANEFHEQSNDFFAKAKKEQLKISSIQVKIKKAKNGSAG